MAASAVAMWRFSVLLSRWRLRSIYAVAAPFVYRNWLDMFLVNARSVPTTLELRNGERFMCRPGTGDLGVINEAVVLNPYFRRRYVQLKSDAIVVDVGANIGDFTLRAAKLCPDGHVYAVEPILDNCACIQRNIDLNDLANVTVVRAALGAEDGEVQIHRQGSHSSKYWGNGGIETVPSLSLTSLLARSGIETIDLLKMDCEGAEWDILPAAEHLLPRIRQICMEYHNGARTAEWLQEWLTERGFVVRRTSGAWNGLLWAWREPGVRSS